jgi:predicted nucleic acid-binding protein
VVFVDTNILVYTRDAAAVRKQAAAVEWLQRLWVERRCRTSMQVLGEYYTTVTRRLRPGMKPDDAWADVLTFLTWKPQPIDGDVLRRAREIERRHRLSWWDSTIVASALLQDCTLLLTEDLQHGMVIDGVKILDPFRAGVAEDIADYAAPPMVVSRHPKRGRPRRRVA